MRHIRCAVVIAWKTCEYKHVYSHETSAKTDPIRRLANLSWFTVGDFQKYIVPWSNLSLLSCANSAYVKRIPQRQLGFVAFCKYITGD